MGKKKSASRSRKRTSSSRRGKDGSDLTQISTSELTAEIRRRERRLQSLRLKRESMLTRLADLDAEITSQERGLGQAGQVARKRGVVRRPRNKLRLVDALEKALDGRTMSVTEVADFVQREGYRTTSPNFRTIVNQTLIGYKTRFKRVSRGQYTAK